MLWTQLLTIYVLQQTLLCYNLHTDRDGGLADDPEDTRMSRGSRHNRHLQRHHTQDRIVWTNRRPSLQSKTSLYINLVQMLFIRVYKKNWWGILKMYLEYMICLKFCTVTMIVYVFATLNSVDYFVLIKNWVKQIY